MTAPSYYATDFARFEAAGCTDVADVITAVDTMLTATLPADSRWTSLGAGEYRCPYQDPAGANRFFSIILIADSATRLSFQVNDKNGTAVIDRSITFTTSMTYRVWAGPYHICIEFEYGAGPTYQQAIACMIDPTPFGLQSVWPYVVAWADRSNVGAVDYSNYANYFFMSDVATPQGRVCMQGCGVNTSLKTSGGNNVVLPAEVEVRLAGAVWWGAGKMYQFAVVGDTLNYKTALTVPLDSGISGEFEVLGRSVTGFSTQLGLLAIRKA